MTGPNKLRPKREGIGDRGLCSPHVSGFRRSSSLRSKVKQLITMESAFGNFLTESSWSDNMFASQTIQRCPFLRNINEPTNFSMASVNSPPSARGVKGPIFQDGPNFETAFRLFHGKDGVVPLSGREYIHNDSVERKPAPQFNPLAAKAATISLSSFGFGGPFGFDFFSKKLKQNKKSSRREPSSEKGGDSAHEALSNEWLETGQCPIAKSFRAVKFVVPLVAKALQPPPGMKYKCPPAIVAARAALARTAFVRDLRPQPLPAKMLNIALLGMAANIPLGIWREHTKRFSPQWFVAIHAAVPFIAMLRKAVLMPKTAMVITIAASILGQTIGSRAERIRLKAVAARPSAYVATVAFQSPSGHCGEERVWDPLPMKSDRAGSPSAPASKAGVCY